MFISSTSEDLKEYRAAARAGAIGAGLLPVMMEDFTANGEQAPHGFCMEKVRGCDVLVVIVAHRYGWKPEGQAGKSITWLECLEARAAGMEVLAFLVAENCEWRAELREEYRIAAAVAKGSGNAKLLSDVRRDVKQLAKFKKELNSKGIRGTFSNPGELQRRVESALRDWVKRKWESDPDDVPEQEPEPAADPSLYLDHLRENCSWIDIRGLQVGTGKAHRFPIEELYIPLTMAGGSGDGPGARMSVPLEEALREPRLVVVGDPGSGKTTFSRHAALQRVREYAEGKAGAAFPAFIRISDLWEFMRARVNGERPGDSPGWLAAYLAFHSAELREGLEERYFQERLEKGPAVLLLDGLDEAPGARERETVVRLIEKAMQAYRNCRFVVTTRPQSYRGRGALSGIPTVHIEPLETAAIEKFLERWCGALFPEGGEPKKKHLGELLLALRRVPEIRRMARTPVMLTALAVVHWNERRLPEQRADLYESVVMWLARAREQRPGRATAEQCVELLQELALAMQKADGGRQVEVEKGWAAQVLAARFVGGTEADRQARALRFVEEEEFDSGIVVSRGANVRFWHLTFQEYLAARAIAGMVEADQRELLLEDGRLHLAEWRETALLLGGVLCGRQGRAKVDGLMKAALDRLGPNADLAAKAKCAGLLGAMVNDLRPFQYQPADGRYRELMDAVLGIFEKDEAARIEFAVRLEAAEALGQAGDPRLAGEKWVRIEGGTLLMGKGEGRPVEVKGFEIGKYPVTVEEYRRFVEDDGYAVERWWSAGGFGVEKEPGKWEEQKQHPNWPVVRVSWFEAAAYCAWADVRLLREKEWEWAARGAERREYPWGGEEPDATRANYFEAGPGHATPVGLYPAGGTPEGVLDLAGNVWEWLNDWSDDTRTRRVLRGGAWYYDAANLRAAERDDYGPDYRDFNIGFRVARELPLP